MTKPKTIFIFAYYSYKDPVFQSAVLPYFEDFPNKENFRFVLLNFEQDQHKTSASERAVIQKHLAQHNIIWYNTKWHSGRFKLIKKAFDFSWGLLLSLFLVIRYRAKAIYSEGFPGAIIGHILAKITFRKHMVHTFEPHADYMVEAGEWAENAWETRLLRSFERKIAKRCSHIFTATDSMIEKLKKAGSTAQMHRVPSCVDLKLFQFQNSNRVNIRKQLNILDEELTIVYLGKFGGMYMEEEFFDFCTYCFEQTAVKFRFIVLTTHPPEPLAAYIKERNLPQSSFFINKVTKQEVPAYLAASDFAFCGIRAIPSRRYSSPIKDGEYWACGLPILIPKGISDDYIFAQEHNLGIVLEEVSSAHFRNAVQQIITWHQQEDAKTVRQRCVNFVQKDRNVETYRKLYSSIFAQL